MLSFNELARKNFSQKIQWNRILWTLALQAVKTFFHLEKVADHLVVEEPISGHLRYQTLFLKTSDQSLKISLFKEKKNLIAFINVQFEKMGYQQVISDIRLK